MTKIVPAINVDSSEEYIRQLKIIRQLTDRYQVDLLDGKYVENTSLMPEDLQKPVDAKLDIHLMVLDIAGYIRRVIPLNPYTIMFQTENCKTQREMIGYIDTIHAAGFRAGIALNPEVEPASLARVIAKVDHVLVMAYPAGFSGQKLMSEVLVKPAQIRAIAPRVEVGLDGGLSHNTIKKIAEAKFDVVYTTTYLFRNPEKDPLSVYSELLGAFA